MTISRNSAETTVKRVTLAKGRASYDFAIPPAGAVSVLRKEGSRLECYCMPVEEARYLYRRLKKQGFTKF